MEVYNLITINFCCNDIKNININSLKDTILKYSKRMSEDITDTRFEDFTFPSTPELELLINKIKEDYFKKFNKKIKLLDYWSQIHLPNESTNLHDHINDSNINDSPDISGVYYVSIPENAGKLVFEYPINQYQTKKYYFNSCVGTYVLFPSTLNHYVTKNLSSEKRIAISFNFKIEK